MNLNLSPETIDILLQFSTINESIKIEPGNVLRILDKSRTIYACATVVEEFPITVSIASIREFLALYDLFEEPKLTFKKEEILISDGGQKSRYLFADPAAFKDNPKAVKKTYSKEVKIGKHQLNTLLRAAYTLKVPELRFFSDGEGVHVRAVNTELSSSNYYDVLLSPESEKNLDVRLHIERCKILPRDYTIGLGGGSRVIHFMSEGLEYAMAISA